MCRCGYYLDVHVCVTGDPLRNNPGYVYRFPDLYSPRFRCAIAGLAAFAAAGNRDRPRYHRTLSENCTYKRDKENDSLRYNKNSICEGMDETRARLHSNCSFTHAEKSTVVILLKKKKKKNQLSLFSSL